MQLVCQKSVLHMMHDRGYIHCELGIDYWHAFNLAFSGIVACLIAFVVQELEELWGKGSFIYYSYSYADVKQRLDPELRTCSNCNLLHPFRKFSANQMRVVLL